MRALDVTEKEYSFTISDSYTLKTIPMERLAEYMGALARLLGEENSVHFDRVEEGSVALKAHIDEPAQPKVRERLHAVRTGSAPADAQKAYAILDEMLRKDNAYGALGGGGDAAIIPFPGKRRPEPVVFGPFKQDGTIDGEVYRIGGKDETKHINIRSDDRDISVLIASESVALDLRHHLFGGMLRFHGAGTWYRHGDGNWELRSFRVHHFEQLSDVSLDTVVTRLRSIRSIELDTMDDPLAHLLRDRRSGEERA